VFWSTSVYFNIRNTLPKFCPFLLAHPVYSNCQCGLFSKNTPIIRIFCISGWLVDPINLGKCSSTVFHFMKNDFSFATFKSARHISLRFTQFAACTTPISRLLFQTRVAVRGAWLPAGTDPEGGTAGTGKVAGRSR